MQGFVFNLRRDLFKDRRVREAIGLAYDFEWQNKNLSYGFYTRTRSYFGNCELEAKGLPSPEELEDPRAAARARFPTRSSPPSSSRRRPTARATSASRLRKAIAAPEGGRLGDQGRQDDRQGGQASSPSRCCWTTPRSSAMALPVKQNLERIGIDMACAPSTPRSTSAACDTSTST